MSKEPVAKLRAATGNFAIGSKAYNFSWWHYFQNKYLFYSVCKSKLLYKIKCSMF